MKLTEEDKKELRSKLRLSPRQIEIVQAILHKAHRDKELARLTGYTELAAKAAIHEIFLKTQTRSKVELLLKVLEVLGRIAPDE